MAMTRTETWGIGAAVVAHILLLVLLSVTRMSPDTPRFDNPPMEVDLVAEVAPVSSAPVITDEAPATRLGEDTLVDDPAPPEPLAPPPEPLPAVKPEPVPTPKPVVKKPAERPKPAPVAKKPVTKPAPKAPAKATPKAAPKAPAKPATKTGSSSATKPATKSTPRPTGRLDGITDGLTKAPSKAPASKGAPAATTSAAVKKSIDVTIKSAVSTPWNRCTVSGVDVADLKTVVKFRLTKAGALESFTNVTTTGQNDSNRFQVQRHQECAKRAIEVAAPFTLPAENYDAWANYTLDFIKR